MGSEQDLASAFIGRLWDNPSLSGLSPLQKEEQLQQFLESNGRTLQPTLTSPAFFPGMPWMGIQKLLREALAAYTDRALNPLFESVLDQRMNFTFTLHMAHRSASPAAVRDQLALFLKTLTSRPGSRRELAGPVTGVEDGLIDRYIDRIFQRQRYISFELRKVQRLKIDPKEIGDLVKATMLIRPALQYFSPDDPGSKRNMVLVSPIFAGKVAAEAARALPLMPEVVVKGGVNSALSFQDNPYLDGTSRLAALFAHRCRNLKAGMLVDRGAETSDKSWFSVARKNYRFYGFDPDMLTELHGIATENGW